MSVRNWPLEGYIFDASGATRGGSSPGLGVIRSGCSPWRFVPSRTGSLAGGGFLSGVARFSLMSASCWIRPIVTGRSYAAAAASAACVADEMQSQQVHPTGGAVRNDRCRSLAA
jgi:hypothetical protein